MERTTTQGTLKHGLKVGNEVHKHFVMREALAGDIFDAENDATADKPTAFRGALIARQLVSIGGFHGPFTLKMIGQLKATDLATLMKAQQELDALGEDEPLVDPAG
jgi:phage FluMu protein gp41